ncbi:MAG: hypothetical protein GW809_02070 [Bacteroidetes bacterium]|nr:hypothetical protein [Bacteroidota bacterium]NCQ10937.1 hypothetical protein [Bacteroidota bacterium]
MKEVRLLIPDQSLESVQTLLSQLGLAILESNDQNWHRQVLLDRIQSEIEANLSSAGQEYALMMIGKEY